MQLHGEHRCIMVELNKQRKHGGGSACRFCAPANCPPPRGQKCHCGVVGNNRVARARFGEFRACNCMASIVASWLNLISNENMAAAALAVFIATQAPNMMRHHDCSTKPSTQYQISLAVLHLHCDLLLDHHERLEYVCKD